MRQIASPFRALILILMLIPPIGAAQQAVPGVKPLELRSAYTVDLRTQGFRKPKRGFMGTPNDPGSIYGVACTQNSIAVTIDGNVVFFRPETGEKLDTLNPFSLAGYSFGFTNIFPTADGHFLLDLHDISQTGRHGVLLVGARGEAIKVLDLSEAPDQKNGSWGVTVSVTGKSFLLAHFVSGEIRYQLRDAETFVVRQTWIEKQPMASWRWLADNRLLRIWNFPQPLGRGNRAGKEQPLQVASPGTEPRNLGEIVGGDAAILNDERILAIHVNELITDLVDDYGQVLRRYEAPFSGAHLYFGLAAVASDGQYFAAHLLGQKNFFLPGQEYVYVWNIDNSEPVASAQFKWTPDESAIAFCPGSKTLAVVNHGKLQLFKIADASKSPVPNSFHEKAG
jgi:hypothetical protein